MKKKTVLQLALMSVCVTLLLIAGVTFAANAEPVGGDCGVNGDNVKWEFNPDSGELRIYGEGEMEDFYSYGESFSTPWSEYADQIKTIKIDDGVTNIGDNAFGMCGSLISADIPDSVTSIGKNAFYECNSLTSIDIPDGVRSIGDRAFVNCKKANYIYISGSVESIGYLAFAGCSESLEEIAVAEVNQSYSGTGNCLIQKESGSLLLGCKNSKIPSDGSVNGIGMYAFDGCSNLTSIDIPDSVTYIASSAFYGCSNLTSIDIPDAVTEIGSEAFRGCSRLSTVNISPEGKLTEIYYSVFSGCYSISSINIPIGLSTDIYSGWMNIFSECHIDKVFVYSLDVVPKYDDYARLGNCTDTIYFNPSSNFDRYNDYTVFPYNNNYSTVINGVGWNVLTKDSSFSDGLNGYVQFRSNGYRPFDQNFLCDMRVLVEGNSELLMEYKSATVTLTFYGDYDDTGSSKQTEMMATMDKAYTSVLANGEVVSAREGYGFVGLVVTGIKYYDFWELSASITLTDKNGDSVTYNLGWLMNVQDAIDESTDVEI